jgi:hypothetical protein
VIAIYVTKEWIRAVGSAADLFLFEDEPKGDNAILMAADKNMDASYPFVYAEALRHPSTTSENKKPFIPVWIPTSEVKAIFNFTEADSRKIGFKTE